MTGTIVVTSRSFSQGTVDVESRLTDAGYRVVRGDTHHDPSSLAPQLAEAIAWIAGTSPVTAELLDAAPKLRLVARYGVGFDAVDLAAAAQRGITVTNTPGANSESVADLALALLLSSLRTLGAGDAAVRAGDWSVIRGREIGSLEVGVAGFGRIGRLFATRVRALGARVLAYDPFLGPDEQLPDGYRRAATIGELASCDAVSLHAPGGAVVVDADWLSTARGLALVNTARADLVVESEVAVALRDGRLASYAGDSLASEASGESASPLLDEDLRARVLITPHLGAQTEQAIDRMGVGAVDNVLAVLAGRAPLNPVSAPPTSPGKAPS